MENDLLLKVRDLEAVYSSDSGTVHAVNKISFDLHEKETLGIVGETGAGKTTTALAIMGLLPERNSKVLAGNIFFQNSDLLKKNKTEMRFIRGELISMIFQDPMTALNPVMIVGDQVLESLKIHQSGKMSPAEMDAKVDELFRLVGISPGRKKEYPHQFSGGMKQRIVIAIALACEPLLMIADEPTTALDVTIQAQVLALMEDLKQKLNMSMILITHDLGIVAEVCDRVAIMYAGELVEQGSAKDFFESEFHHPYTQGLLGALPDLNSQTRRLHPIPGLMADPTKLPSGCKFHPRCPKAMQICSVKEPYKYEKDGHQVVCHLMSGMEGRKA
ncbi:MAG: ABC transporter ATP-binding protein [Anaerolineaceae bacterium]|nr:ABC transporter ATP-binding protein [Anaerolineaceae bacterium]